MQSHLVGGAETSWGWGWRVGGGGGVGGAEWHLVKMEWVTYVIAFQKPSKWRMLYFEYNRLPNKEKSGQLRRIWIYNFKE